MRGFVGINKAKYNKQKNTICFDICHTDGCGTYYDYIYQIVDINYPEKSITLAIFLETDNTCESFTFISGYEMDFPKLPFKPNKLIFNKGTPQEIIIDLEQ